MCDRRFLITDNILLKIHTCSHRNICVRCMLRKNHYRGIRLLMINNKGKSVRTPIYKTVIARAPRSTINSCAARQGIRFRFWLRRAACTYRVQARLHPNSGVSVASFSMVIIRRAERASLRARVEPALSPDNLDSHCRLRWR